MSRLILTRSNIPSELEIFSSRENTALNLSRMLSATNRTFVAILRSDANLFWRCSVITECSAVGVVGVLGLPDHGKFLTLLVFSNFLHTSKAADFEHPMMLEI